MQQLTKDHARLGEGISIKQENFGRKEIHQQCLGAESCRYRMSTPSKLSDGPVISLSYNTQRIAVILFRVSPILTLRTPNPTPCLLNACLIGKTWA